MSCIHEHEDHFEEMRKHLTEHLLKYTNGTDIQGLELSSLIRMLANYYNAAITQKTVFGELSGPRMGILLHLLVMEEMGNTQGIKPTGLSHFQHVKKNTISSLLRGLEESSLIERTPDPEDKRSFRIRITKTGKELIQTVGPHRLKMMNDLASGLSNEERTQLINLLEKLRKSIKDRADFLLRPISMISEDDFSD